jgi:glycosyltransferase involved in cell wall biosynthesis
MRIAFVYANSWEYAYPRHRADIDAQVWRRSDDFIMKYPRAVQAYGVEPVLFYLSETARDVATFPHKYGFPLKRVPVRIGAGRMDREFSFRLLREVAREACDLLHVYHPYRNRRFPDMFDWIAVYARLRGLRFVAHYQAGAFPHANPRSRVKQALLWPRRLLKRYALNAAERIFSLNREALEALTNPRAPGFCGFAFPAAKCVYLPNIVDPALFAPMDKAAARAALGLDPGARYVLYVGFLRVGKGVQDLLAAWPRVRAARPDARLLIVGEGPYAPALRRQADALGPEGGVTFAGAVPNDGLRPYYCAADAHVLPSHFESFGSVLIESMACGTPSVGTRVGGIPEVLSDGAGLVVQPGDADALVAALAQILDGGFRIPPEVRARKLQHYSFENAGRILYEAYRAILGGDPA